MASSTIKTRVGHLVLHWLLLSWGASWSWPWFLFHASIFPSELLSFHIQPVWLQLGRKQRKTKRACLASSSDSLNIKIQLQREQNNRRFDLGRLSGVMHTLTCLTAWRALAQSSNCGFWHCLSPQHVWGFWRAAGCSSAVCFCPSPDRNLNPSFESCH